MVYNTDKPLRVKNKESDGKMFTEKTRKSYCSAKIVEFCNRTDLHGYKYVVMEDLNVFERSCWALAVLVSLVVGIIFVTTAYNWYARNPIVTVIESTQGAIWDVPFPAVTICDLNLISRKAARAFADNLTLPEHVTAEFVFRALRLAPLLHSPFIVPMEHKRDLYTLQAVLDLNNISLEKLFKQLSPVESCGHLVERCMWKNTVYRCDQLFQQVFTLQNLCCSFNYFALENKDGSFLNVGPSSPRRVASCGYQTALTVLVNTDPADYYSTFVASEGALVFIDDSYNIPDMDSPLRLVNPASEMMIALSPERTYSTPGIRSFRPERRQCYFFDEVSIGSFRQYSFHNCLAFQKVELIRMACECVPFYFPTKEYYRSCNFNDIDCMQSFLKLDEYHNYGNFGSTFQCLPECEHYNYNFEVALGSLSENIHLNGHPFFNKVDLTNRSLVNVFFNDLVSTKYRRDVYLNWQNILAAFGGLLSLMLGFTLISGFDMVLFFTFRVAYDFINYHLDKSNRETKKVKVDAAAVQQYKINGWFNGNLANYTKNDDSLRKW